MASVTTAIKLQVVKELLAISFVNANELSIIDGLTFKYKSYPYEDKVIKGWKFDISVADAGYGERTIQEFKFNRPDNIDAKNMEYHVIVEIMTRFTQASITTWYELGKALALDKDLQKQAKESLNEKSKDIIITDK